MKNNIYRALFLFLFFAPSITVMAQSGPQTAEKKFQTQTEVILPIKDFGHVYYVPFAADKPDPNMKYKIVFEASAKIDSAAQLYTGLEYFARMFNLHVYGGVPKENLDVVLVIAGQGIPVVMNNEAYKKRYGVDNPNLKVLEQIKAAGIKINGCAQAMLKHSVDPAVVNPIVQPIFSRFTTISAYQMKGYAYFVY